MITGTVGYVLARSVDSPEPLVVFGILALLSPIPAIAFAHHLFHLFLGRFIPVIQAPEIGSSQGLLPGLISWWEGLRLGLVMRGEMGLTQMKAKGKSPQTNTTGGSKQRSARKL